MWTELEKNNKNTQKTNKQTNKLKVESVAVMFF